MDVKTVRARIWEGLPKAARSDSKFSWEFPKSIAGYEGSDKGAALLTSTGMYKNAKVTLITPDNNLGKLRETAFRDKRTVVMIDYGITRGFFLIKPEFIPEGEGEVTSLLDGVSRYWKHQTLEQLEESVGHIDMLVTSASAITPSDVRFGKGHGYFDLEWAMLYTMGIVSETPAIAGTGHDCQAADVDATVEEYDIAIDYIVTSTRIIETRHEFPRPVRGIIWCRPASGTGEQILPVQELWCKVYCK